MNKEPRADWALKAFHTNNWAMIAARHLFDDMFLANEAIATAIQLTFTFETGFTNVQFLGLAADAMNLGDVEFGAMISSIQTDEARHAHLLKLEDYQTVTRLLKDPSALVQREAQKAMQILISQQNRPPEWSGTQ